MDTLTFDGSNFDEFSSELLGPDASVTSHIESGFGTATTYETDNHRCRGRVEFYRFASGMHVVVFDSHWHTGVSYAVRDGDFVRFNFSLAIDVDMHFVPNDSVKVQTPSWRIINNPADADVTEAIPPHTDAVWVTVFCKPSHLQKLTGVHLDDMPDFLQDAVDQLSDRSHHEFYDFTSRLNSITADVLRTKIHGALRLPFVEARAVELLCYALDHLMHPQAELSGSKIVDADRVALEQARSILMKEWAHPPTVSELSKSIGINRNKLFYGFKSLFGITISEFIQEQRLEEGRRLLRETDLPASEIANAIGFRHQSNFSTAIRKRYGVTPRQLRG